ncbi:MULTISPECIES: hypothetical protein [unclassified Ruegeria]|uniref:hypothetical protein n=1 Tax=unclassified Ruegeria TaxID=2625375 RepID=UPI001AE4D389|nr:MULTISPECIES: hypothetical protein [unclassified Ruegeria]
MNLRISTSGAGAISTRQASTELDCETAALLRAAIRPIFVTAASWGNLADILKDKGYRLVFRQGRLCITDRATDARICGLRFLDIEFRELISRLGRPIVVATGDGANGDVLAERPTSDQN